jgi:adenylosuccinate synthase
LAVGKTAVRTELVAQHGFAYLRSSEHLRVLAKTQGLNSDRLTLQNLGDGLDVSTDYRWLIDDVARPAIEGSPNRRRWIVDAVRKKRQIEHFREAFGGAVHHVHFTASEEILRERYVTRQKEQGSDADMTPYEAAIDHDNERAACALIECADVVIDLGSVSTSVAVDSVLQQIDVGFV